MYIADLHIHSKYSRATSRECVPEYLQLWARRKGIRLLGTGDFTHPAQRSELKEKLEPAEDGLYRLKDEYVIRDPITGDREQPRFVLSGEISSIYKKNGKTRKVHNLILLPGLKEAEQLSHRLEAIGNIHSDGRPILGLDSRDLLEITLETCPNAIFIPAHIWTPHFSLFGAFSGFNTIEECFEDLTCHIHALETGLSSDPPMNWRVSALDRYNLVSNSDAHSPAKLGREANLLDTELSYEGLSQAIQEGKGLLGTIEFFPEEGKYHLDGHRKCGQCLTPAQTKDYGGRCPVCGRKITIGVLHRIEELADREQGYEKPGACRFESLAPLPEVIAASTGKSATSVKVQRQYEAMLGELGSEFSILRDVPLEAIRSSAGPCIEEGIKRLRQGKVERIPGYDGEYGRINIIDKEEIQELCGQLSLFESIALPAGSLKKKSEKNAVNICKETGASLVPQNTWMQEQGQAEGKAGNVPETEKEQVARISHNPEQQQAITSESPVTAVIAGPGTGKTHTLIQHIAWLLQEGKARASDITAITFTNQGARELKIRLERILGKQKAKPITACTFHSLCLSQLKEARGQVSLADEQQQMELAARIMTEWDLKLAPNAFLKQVSALKNSRQIDLADGEQHAQDPDKQSALMHGQDAGKQGRLQDDQKFLQAAGDYTLQLREQGLYDFDDLLLEALTLKTGLGENSRLLVDEFQDINPVQYQLICQWSKGGRELFAIGDPDQAIYGFRGADARCFEKLGAHYPETRTIVLTKNYRSEPQILDSALPVINQNPGAKRILEPAGRGNTAARDHKAGKQDSPGKVRIITAESPLSQGIFAAGAINRMTGGMDMMDAQNFAAKREHHRSFGDIALVYRTRRQARVLETCLQKESIPYTVTGKEDFLQDSAVTGTVAFFRALLLQEGQEASDALEQAGDRLFKTSPKQTAEHLASIFRPKAVGEKELPENLIKQWREAAGFSSHKPLKRLEEMAVFYDNMELFLENLLLGEEQDLRRSACGKMYESGAVSLMTLHAAKGLEFPVVFVCGVDEDVLPMKGSDWEEERRLLYVGMTRAKEELILISSGKPSLFLEDIPKSAAVREEAYKKKPQPQTEQLQFL